MMNRILFIAFATLSMMAVGCGNGNKPVNTDAVHHAPQADYYVAVTGNDENDGISENSAFATLQEAILNAEEGNIIEVLPGTYTGEGNTEVELLGKKITLLSQGGPEATTIDCEGLGRAFHIHEGETPETVLDGFTILNGVAPMGTYGINDYEMSYGGGIFVDGANPTLRNLTIRDCEAGLGGGLTLRYSNTHVSDVRIETNSATYFG
ncbi:MAG: DUF1565 domain-containing protein, partial [Planctomycetota bacterium]|nr:DUF1565 domain-containing protein [Planctomycetota bacterium]